MITNFKIYIIKFIFLLIYINSYKAQTLNLHIAVSANFIAPLIPIKHIFEKKYNCKLIFCVDSTASLYTKIINGAPFDIFLSADTIHPTLLKNKKLATNKITYAKGTLILWIPLIKQSIKKTFTYNNKHILATANPKLSPYGKATKTLLKNINIKPKKIYGCNINQTFNFITTRNSTFGFIALSQIFKNKISKQTYWIIPKYLSPKIKQDAVIIKKTKHPILSKKFIIFLQKTYIKNIIYSYGYKT